MANKSSGRYYAKNTESGTFEDITTLFDGVAVLKVDGFNARGKPVNERLYCAMGELTIGGLLDYDIGR